MYLRTSFERTYQWHFLKVLKTVGNVVKGALKHTYIDVWITSVSNYKYQIAKSPKWIPVIGQLHDCDQLLDKQVREPIMIKNFVIDMIMSILTIIIQLQYTILTWQYNKTCNLALPCFCNIFCNTSILSFICLLNIFYLEYSLVQNEYSVTRSQRTAIFLPSYFGRRNSFVNLTGKSCHWSLPSCCTLRLMIEPPGHTCWKKAKNNK